MKGFVRNVFLAGGVTALYAVANGPRAGLIVGAFCAVIIAGIEIAVWIASKRRKTPV